MDIFMYIVELNGLQYAMYLKEISKMYFPIVFACVFFSIIPQPNQILFVIFHSRTSASYIVISMKRNRSRLLRVTHEWLAFPR